MHHTTRLLSFASFALALALAPIGFALPSEAVAGSGSVWSDACPGDLDHVALEGTGVRDWGFDVVLGGGSGSVDCPVSSVVVGLGGAWDPTRGGCVTQGATVLCLERPVSLGGFVRYDVTYHLADSHAAFRGFVDVLFA